MARVALGLGSNLGDRLLHLRRAVVALDAIGTVIALSSVYETAPVGGPPQGPFLNAVAVVNTARSPEAVLAEARVVERVEGRQRRTRWGPRTLDVDILLYGREAIDVPGLTVPHPRMLERSFVLVPLLEAWPDARMPDGTIPSVRSRASTDEHMTRLAAELRGPSGRREVTTVG